MNRRAIVKGALGGILGLTLPPLRRSAFSQETPAVVPVSKGFAMLTGAGGNVLVRTAGAALRTEGGIQSAVVAFGASLGHSLLATLVFGAFTGAGMHFELGPMLWSAFGTALAAPLVFAVLRRVDAGLLHGEEAARGLR